MRSAMQPYAASCMSNASLVRDGRRRFTAGAGVSRVLLAVDDVDALEALALDLAGTGIAVEAAPTLEACARALEGHGFDLLVLDLSLSQRSGLGLVRDLRARGFSVPFVVIAEQAAVAEIVEAMRLGARTVIETRDAASVAGAIRRELGGTAPAPAQVTPVSLVGAAPARRWAGYVLAATDAAADPRTLADWSRAVGVSRSVIVESCARIGAAPRDARDLARVLRLVRRVDEPWAPETALDVADRRTLRALLVRAGLTGDALHVRPSARHFLLHQRFVAEPNAGLSALWHLIDD
jgi:ActR/RegA family two-component response regulator